MLQLAAIVEADPARHRAGCAHLDVRRRRARRRRHLDLRGRGHRAAEDLGAGRVEQALRLRRQPRKPYDLLAEIWLNPARGHLPVRVRLGSAGADDTIEFELVEALPR